MKVKIIYSNPDFDAETDVTDFSQVTINNYRMTSPSLDMRKITIKPDGPDCTFNNNNIHNDKDNKERALSSSSSKTDSVTELDVKRVSIELPWWAIRYPAKRNTVWFSGDTLVAAYDAYLKVH